jgi:hypothetical protein
MEGEKKTSKKKEEIRSSLRLMHRRKRKWSRRKWRKKKGKRWKGREGRK